MEFKISKIQGERYFKKAIEIDPNCGNAYQYLSQIALRKNQKNKSMAFFGKSHTVEC